jgi:hypothetical protein
MQLMKSIYGTYLIPRVIAAAVKRLSSPLICIGEPLQEQSFE